MIVLVVWTQSFYLCIFCWLPPPWLRVYSTVSSASRRLRDFERCSFFKHFGFYLTASFVSTLLPFWFCNGMIPQPGAQLLGTGFIFVPWERSSLCCASVSFKSVSKSKRVGETLARLLYLAPLGFPADLQVGGGLEEARVAVFLHQGVDFGLGQLEARLSWVLHVLFCDGFGHMVKIYLTSKRINGFFSTR